MKKHINKYKKHYLAGLSFAFLVSLAVVLQMQGDVTAKNNLMSNVGGDTAAEFVPQKAFDNAASQASFKRILVTPSSTENEAELRALLPDVRHEFNGKFTANIPNNLLEKVNELATIEEVPIHQLTSTKNLLAAKPVCGNGIAEGGEKCGEPGLSCAEGRECVKCKCIDETPEEPVTRSCIPENQIEYNVAQVNGGATGAGTGVTVAVLDTGVDTDHLDLVNNVKTCKDATKRGIRNGCDDKNAVGHGTHSAGIVGADSGSDGQGIFGVAPNVNLMTIKVCGPAGCFTDDIAAAINYAAENGADIVNMSFGGSTESSLIRDAIANNPELLYIASAGNSGPGANTIGYPAANPAVVAVAANDSGKVVASFSSRGVDDGNDATIAAREVELTAGGVTVEAPHKNGCYSKLSGTSFSSPTIAGLAAAVWQGSAAATRIYLVSSAEDITVANGGGAGIGFDAASGYGLPSQQ